MDLRVAVRQVCWVGMIPSAMPRVGSAVTGYGGVKGTGEVKVRVRIRIYQRFGVVIGLTPGSGLGNFYKAVLYHWRKR